jgi:uncharacterized membrane protein YphA (DoxX/SURF4 family)
LALVDPFAGEMRAAGHRDGTTIPLSVAIYFALSATVLVLWDLRPDSAALVLALVASVIGVAAERFKVRYVDDDFLMAVLPAGAMTALALVL